jgi:hypothetical protein
MTWLRRKKGNEEAVLMNWMKGRKAPE